MKLDDPLFGITPESLKAVNVDLPSSKSLSVVDSQMPVSTEHERVIASKLVRIHNRTSSYRFDGMIENFLCGHIPHNFNFNNPFSFKDAKDRDFVPGSSSSFALASSSEIGLIGFDLSLQQYLTINTVGSDSLAYNLEGLQHSRVGETYLYRRLPGRHLQFKELDEPQPVLTGDGEFPDPSPGEVSKLIPAPTTAISSTSDSIDLFASTMCAKNTAIFSTQLCKIPLSRFFSLYKGFK